MNVLLVDDEQHVREAVKLLVDWQALGIEGIYEADNGDEAIRLIEAVQPELVITDMRMPIRDGIDLLAWIQASGRPIRKIVISGHDDFDLVRGAMKFGGSDYLLKPIDPEQLQEAIRKAAESWRQEDCERRLNQKRNIEMNTLKPVYWDKLFSNLIAEPGTFRAARDNLAEEFGLDVSRECQVALLSVDTMSRPVTDKFARNRDLLFFTLANVCNEFVRPGNRGIACRHWNSEHELLILIWDRFADVPDTLARINEGFRVTLGCRFDIGLGPKEAFPAGLGSSYRAARSALRGRNLLAMESRIHPFEPGRKTTGEALRVFDHEESFRLAVLNGSESEIAAAVGRWMEAVRKLSGVTLEQMELWRHEMNGLAERLSKDGGNLEERNAADPHPIPLRDDGRLSLERWEEELRARFAHIAQRQGNERQKERNVMAEIARYVETNYNRELTLQDIASQFYLSREYISRRFKQDFGENLSDFLGRIRIEKARLLLGNPSLKITEIAEMVGYADEKYFSKVFKKLEGVSPNQFRKG